MAKTLSSIDFILSLYWVHFSLNLNQSEVVTVVFISIRLAIVSL